jgi:hypothetical protein
VRFFNDSLEDKIVFIISFRVEGRPVATSTSSRSSISGLSTKRLASTLNDIIYYIFSYGLCRNMSKIEPVATSIG